MTVTGANGGPFTVTFGGTLANQNVPNHCRRRDEPGTGVQCCGRYNHPGQYRAPGLNPYTTMSEIASDPSKFYCLHPPTIGGVQQTCNGASAANLNQIFKDIGTDITGTRTIYFP